MGEQPANTAVSNALRRGMFRRKLSQRKRAMRRGYIRRPNCGEDLFIGLKMDVLLTNNGFVYYGEFNADWVGCYLQKLILIAELVTRASLGCFVRPPQQSVARHL